MGGSKKVYVGAIAVLVSVICFYVNVCDAFGLTFDAQRSPK